MKTTQLLKELTELTMWNKKEAQNLMDLPLGQLNARPSNGGWTSFECIEHLNRYGDFYIPEINRRLSIAKPSPADNYSPGILGNYFAKSMMPKDKLNTMKTFKSMNPIDSDLDKKVLVKFIDQQDQLMQILENASNYNLNKVKTSISISKWIKLKLGDTLRVVIYHNQRHILQANRACAR